MSILVDEIVSPHYSEHFDKTSLQEAILIPIPRVSMWQWLIRDVKPSRLEEFELEDAPKITSQCSQNEKPHIPKTTKRSNLKNKMQTFFF